MADRKVTVVNPAGYQEQLPDSDNLLLAATPTANTHAVNKLYVDTSLANIDLTDIEQDIDRLEQDVTTLQGDVTTLQGDVSTIQGDLTTLEASLNAEIGDRQAGDQSLQDQIDAIIAQGELQTLQDVTDLGSTTTNDMESYGTITAAVLVGDIDQGEY